MPNPVTDRSAWARRPRFEVKGACAFANNPKIDKTMSKLVTKLGHDVKIVIGPVRRRPGRNELQFA